MSKIDSYMTKKTTPKQVSIMTGIGVVVMLLAIVATKLFVWIGGLLVFLFLAFIVGCLLLLAADKILDWFNK